MTPPPVLALEIDRRHIYHGIRASRQQCPIALALWMCPLKPSMVLLHNDSVDVWINGGQRHTYRLLKSSLDFIGAFDAGFAVRPTVLNLVLEKKVEHG